MPQEEAGSSPVPVAELAPPAGSEFARPLPDVGPVLPGPDVSPATASPPEVSAPDPATGPAPDTGPAARPDPLADPGTVSVPGPEAAPAPRPIAEAPTAPPEDLPRLAPPRDEPAPEAAQLPPPPPLNDDELALMMPQPEAAAPDQPQASQLQQAEAPAGPPAPGQAGDDTTDPVPQPGLDRPVEGVTTGRLPRIGDNDAAAAAPQPDPGPLPPVQRYASAFDNPGRKPLFTVVLIDTGGPGIDREALAALPFPVSFAIDPLAADAATAAAIYRAAGQEVLMIATGIPAGAKASDMEVTFQTHAATLPEAVAVLDPETGGFQASRALSAQMADILKAQGRGLVSWDRGLNAADQVARREGLPAALIFRKLDAGDEAAPAIRRYLDRAAFKAAQDGRVLVIGDTRPETIAALLEWSVEGRSATVALAPVTAVLSVQ